VELASKVVGNFSERVKAVVIGPIWGDNMLRIMMGVKGTSRNQRVEKSPSPSEQQDLILTTSTGWNTVQWSGDVRT
jgi:hypothetical protein